MKYNLPRMLIASTNSKINEKGFTLVELMIAMAVGGIIMTAVMTSFLSQHRSYLAQDDVVEMQQNGRVAMDMLIREIRMAGFDPTNDANATITDAREGQISFTMDITDDLGTGPSDGDVADPGEMIDFGFGLTNDVDRNGITNVDVNGDGVFDPASLGRQTGGAGGYQPVAENIQSIEFQYLDTDGSITADLDKIRSVRISLLAAARNPDQNFTNTMTYTTASGTIWGPYNDNLRRRLFITTVKFRNIGL